VSLRLHFENSQSHHIQKNHVCFDESCYEQIEGMRDCLNPANAEIDFGATNILKTCSRDDAVDSHTNDDVAGGDGTSLRLAFENEYVHCIIESSTESSDSIENPSSHNSGSGKSLVGDVEAHNTDDGKFDNEGVTDASKSALSPIGFFDAISPEGSFALQTLWGHINEMQGLLQGGKSEGKPDVPVAPTGPLSWAAGLGQLIGGSSAGKGSFLSGFGFGDAAETNANMFGSPTFGGPVTFSGTAEGRNDWDLGMQSGPPLKEHYFGSPGSRCSLQGGVL